MVRLFAVLLAFYIVHGSNSRNNGYSTLCQEKGIKYFDLQRDPETLIVKDMGEKGRGVITTRGIRRGQFICEYTGELLTEEEGDEREQDPKFQTDRRIYLYVFECSGKTWVIDSSEDSGRVGRLINHKRKYPNVIELATKYDGVCRLYFVAKRDILPYEELTLDYGTYDELCLAENPWLKD